MQKVLLKMHRRNIIKKPSSRFFTDFIVEKLQVRWFFSKKYNETEYGNLMMNKVEITIFLQNT